MRRWRTASALALLLWVRCLGTPEDVRPASPEPLAREDFCPLLTLELCEGHMTCCDDAKAMHGSLEACIEDQSARCARAFSEERTEGLGYDALAAGGLFARIEERRRSCESPFAPWGRQREPSDVPHRGWQDAFRDEVWSEVFSSPAVAGEACVLGRCAEGLFCESTGTSLGTLSGCCRPFLAEGEVGCSAGLRPRGCAPGLVCFAEGSGDAGAALVPEGRCAVPGDAGAACTAGTCAGGLRCGPGGVCIDAASPLPDGAPCEFDGACSGGLCEDGACAPRPPERDYCPIFRIFG